MIHLCTSFVGRNPAVMAAISRSRFLCVLVLALACFHSVVSFSNEDRTEVERILGTFIGEKLKQCGNSDWRSKYSDFHRKELLKEKDKKILVAIPNLSGKAAPIALKDFVFLKFLCAGLADRLIGASTASLIAILTNRAFQIGRRKELPQLESAFESAFFNWTRSQDEDWLIEPLKHKANPRNYNETVIQSHDYFAVNTLDDYRLQDRLLRGNLNELMGGEARTTLMVINRGKTIRMFENQNHAQQLKEMGLLPETAFGCMLLFLVKPKPEIFAPVLPLLKEISSNEKTLKIGIQIRSGDRMMQNPHHQVHVDEFSAFFSCAEQIEQFALASGKYDKVKWLLVTDIKSIRESAVKKYGSEKLMTSLQVHIEHSSKESSVCTNCDPVSLHGFTGAAAEWFTLAMADYFVISRYSGFGRSAAMLSMKSSSVYTVINGKEKAPITCNSQSFTDLETMSYEWSGI